MNNISKKPETIRMFKAQEALQKPGLLRPKVIPLSPQQYKYSLEFQFGGCILNPGTKF